MPFKIFYQVCKYPHESLRNKYMVRKFIYNDDNKDNIKFLKNENYVYGERNLNKLNIQISKMNYNFESIHASSFNNVPFPVIK